MPRRPRRKLAERSLRIGVFVLSLAPFALLTADAVTGGLGANPIEEATHRTGWWALAFLMLTLAVTPVRRILGWGALVKLRRMLGLFAFFYALTHFGIYIGLDQFFAFDYIIEDITERPYITVGFTALLLMVPLALTSTKRMIKRLGGKRWTRLHKLVYPIAALGVLHFFWLVKADTREPLIFGGVLAVLLGYRALTERLRQLRAQKAKLSEAALALEPRSTPTEGAGAH
jgi:sulfoxide reductase heme-binding subunit YedZ